jgi:hypothetical protein
MRLTTGAGELLGHLRPRGTGWTCSGAGSRSRNGMLDMLLAMIESGEITHAQTRTELLTAVITILDAGGAAGDLRSDVTAEDIAASSQGQSPAEPSGGRPPARRPAGLRPDRGG